MATTHHTDNHLLQQGRCIIVSAPSGAGKTTIVKHLLDMLPRLAFSVSACSRPKREGETEGKDYYFLHADDFRGRIDRGEFLEWEEVYPGSYYGTLRSEVDRIWKMGRHLIFDVDVFGGIRLKEIFGDRALSLFVMPPSPEVLEERLRKRSTDTEESLTERIAKAKLEMDQHNKFDITLINDDLLQAKSEAFERVSQFLYTA